MECQPSEQRRPIGDAGARCRDDGEGRWHGHEFALGDRLRRQLRASFAGGSEVVLTARAERLDVCRLDEERLLGYRRLQADADANRSVSADFAPARETHTLAVETTGKGAGTVTSSPSGIDCGGSCEASLPVVARSS